MAVRLLAGRERTTHDGARKPFVNLRQSRRDVNETLRGCRIFVCGNVEESAYILHREAPSQQADGAKESNRDRIELEACSGSVNRIVFALERLREGLRYPGSLF